MDFHVRYCAFFYDLLRLGMRVVLQYFVYFLAVSQTLRPKHGAVTSSMVTSWVSKECFPGILTAELRRRDNKYKTKPKKERNIPAKRQNKRSIDRSMLEKPHTNRNATRQNTPARARSVSSPETNNNRGFQAKLCWYCTVFVLSYYYCYYTATTIYCYH